MMRPSRSFLAGAQSPARVLAAPCPMQRGAVDATRCVSGAPPKESLFQVIASRLTLKLSCKRSVQYAAHRLARTSIAIGGNHNASATTRAWLLQRLVRPPL